MTDSPSYGRYPFSGVRRLTPSCSSFQLDDDKEVMKLKSTKRSYSNASSTSSAKSREEKKSMRNFLSRKAEEIKSIRNNVGSTYGTVGGGGGDDEDDGTSKERDSNADGSGTAKQEEKHVKPLHLSREISGTKHRKVVPLFPPRTTFMGKVIIVSVSAILFCYTFTVLFGEFFLIPMNKSDWCSAVLQVVAKEYENPDYITDPCRYERIPYLFWLTPEECDLSRRMLASVLFGGAVGYERRASDRPAGIRTMGLVSLGSCFFTISSQLAFKSSTMGWDSSRVTAAIPSGVGFLGAGLIWKGSTGSGDEQVHQVHGLTTAASLWLSAAVGVGAGGALYFTAAYTTVLVLMVLRYGPKLYLQDDASYGDEDEEEDLSDTEDDSSDMFLKHHHDEDDDDVNHPDRGETDDDKTTRMGSVPNALPLPPLPVMDVTVDSTEEEAILKAANSYEYVSVPPSEHGYNTDSSYNPCASGYTTDSSWKPCEDFAAKARALLIETYGSINNDNNSIPVSPSKSLGSTGSGRMTPHRRVFANRHSDDQDGYTTSPTRQQLQGGSLSSPRGKKQKKKHKKIHPRPSFHN